MRGGHWPLAIAPSAPVAPRYLQLNYLLQLKSPESSNSPPLPLALLLVCLHVMSYQKLFWEHKQLPSVPRCGEPVHSKWSTQGPHMPPLPGLQYQSNSTMLSRINCMYSIFSKNRELHFQIQLIVIRVKARNRMEAVHKYLSLDNQ